LGPQLLLKSEFGQELFIPWIKKWASGLRWRISGLWFITERIPDAITASAVKKRHNLYPSLWTSYITEFLSC
jgi:hypothetical protein